MKKLNMLLFIFGFCLVANAQLQHEDFNSTTLPNNWTVTTTTSGCDWQYGFTGSLPGSGFFVPASFPTGGIVFDDSACGSQFHNQISITGPEIDLIAQNVTSADIEITYNHQSFSAIGIFLVDVWDGNSWINVLTVREDTPDDNTGLIETSIINVSDYINSAFKVKFSWDDENSAQNWGCGVDDYQLINTATVDVENLTDLGFNYYPNPILDNELTIRSQETISSINVYNTIGEQLLLKYPETTLSKIYFEGFPSGVYIIKVATRNRKEIFKIVKQ